MTFGKTSGIVCIVAFDKRIRNSRLWKSQLLNAAFTRPQSGHSPPLSGYVACPRKGAGIFLECIMKYIKLANNKGVAIVDDCDFDILNKYKWHIITKGQISYARASIKVNGKWKLARMHRLILNVPAGMETDHVNRNGLDNRKCNLRACTRSQNNANRVKKLGCASQYKGVCWRKDRQKWEVRVKKNRIVHWVGYFVDEIEAAIAYNERAVELIGEFAKLNTFD